MAQFYKWSILCSVLYIFYFIRISVTDKANEDISNDGIEPQVKKSFNLRKYNDIWLTASKKLPQEKLVTLYRILEKLDRTELDIKHSEKDDKPLKEAVQEHLDQILKDYDLFDDQILDHHNIKFNDERFNKIWEDAIGPDGEYTKEELSNLYKEIRHMEEKIQEFETDLNKTREHGESMENDARITDNHVDLTEDDDQNLDNVNSHLKDKEERLNEHITLMEEKSKAKMEKSGFSDDRVMHLWKSVKNSGNFSSEEMEVIKTELSHFQTQIDKLRHWQKHSDELQKRDGKEGDDTSHEYRQTQDKIKEYKKKVKKYHATMSKKLNMKTEL